mmetsp:Transcript_4591/g.9989  ORF Transcript_4591/g.9989 Transcript_4591/m.9989 type:complete len:95 (+) Transcript_4591:283-567(+)
MASIFFSMQPQRQLSSPDQLMSPKRSFEGEEVDCAKRRRSPKPICPEHPKLALLRQQHAAMQASEHERVLAQQAFQKYSRVRAGDSLLRTGTLH